MRHWIAAASLITLVGCTSPGAPIPDDPYYAPVYPELPPTQVVNTGSIYQDAYANELYSDIKAHRVGDVITVELVEATKAKKSATNEMKKDNSMSLDPITAGGGPVTINGQTLDLNYKEKLDLSKEADADQSNSLNGSISVNVLQVLANGNLVIRGEKWITINDGEEYIRLTGLIRPRDIKPDNTVESTRVANARIQYSGTGTFAESQKTGWLAAFFNGPLWPF
ncbi:MULTISPECIES: flagellar basal body L-ring protein FlgH [unclassified Ferrimonas]|uniref:flagellar basal body L-ring protein FlgH n=1 Tax=unclassified Ferrimonas TaxID=2620587 RepID=UPI002573855D|nr:flagellar basal body L-ring protein FlgH [Ferrimonas sp. YFM]BDY04013.1 flagellar L-ring protein [Ferrimonas sp. YFM]